MEAQTMERAPLFDYRIFFEDCFKYLKRLFYVPISLAVIVSALLCLRSAYHYRPLYEAYATFTVQLNGEYGNTASYYSKATADQLEKTFPAILSSGILNDTVCNDLGVDVLPASIGVSTGNAALFTIHCTSSDPQSAYAVLQSTIKKYPSAGVNTIKAPLNSPGTV